MIQLWQLGAQRADYRIVIELSMTWETQKCDTKQRTRRKCTTMVTPTNSLRPVLNTPRTLHTSRTLLHPCCTTFRVSIVRRVGLSHNSCYIFNILSLGFFVPFFVIMRKWKQTHNARDPHRLCWSLWLSVSWYRFSWARMSTPVHPVGSRAKNVNSYVRKWGERGQQQGSTVDEVVGRLPSRVVNQKPKQM